MATSISASQQYSLTANTGINGFLGSIAASGGMSMSNMYEARFEPGGFSAKLKTKLQDYGFIDLGTNAGAYSALTAFCEEASLPGMMANTGQTTGRLMGEGQWNYAHTKSYQDLTLGWQCDANLLPLKFLNGWMSTIFPDLNGQGPTTSNASAGRTSVNRVAFPDDYMCKELVIKKFERNAGAALGRLGGIFHIYDVWPYAIQSTPISYGASTLLKVTASFYYRRYWMEPVQISPT